MKLKREDDFDIRNKIKEAACVLFRSKGFDNVMISDLPEKLQMEEQVFFSYFKSRDELLEVVWSESKKNKEETP